MIGIYKITNKINQKSYIGQSINIKQRWSQHKTMKGNNKMYKDMLQLGLNNFSFEIIEECKAEQLDEREIYWIQYYDTYNNGYNKTLGGQLKTSTSLLTSKLLDEEQKYKNVTSAQWQIYYYLLSISFYDSARAEDHRFIYKKDLNISQAAKFLGISRPTVYTAIKNLEKTSLLKEFENHYSLYTRDWVKIDKNVLKSLLKFSQNNTKILIY